MSTVTIPVDKAEYESRSAEIEWKKTIGEYSVSVDRQVANDRSNARYIYEENIKDDANFDLTAGFNSFIDKGTFLMNEPCMGTFCSWAIGLQGNTVKEVFGDADFATWRGTLKRIAQTILYDPTAKVEYLKKKAWTIIAQDCDGVIIISESKEYACGAEDLATFTGFKFEQYMTTDDADAKIPPDTESPVDNRPTFEFMVRSDLVENGDTLKLCCGAEIDALMENDEPVEIKTAWENEVKDRQSERYLNTVLQCEMIGVRNIVIGFKRGDLRWRKICNAVKVSKTKLIDFKDEGIKERVTQCYSFLFTVLNEVKKFLETADKQTKACEVSFDPIQGAVEIRSITREEANANGKGVTEEFLKHFNIQ